VVQRRIHLSNIRALLRQFPVVALIGARQVGKTTLAKQLATAKLPRENYFDLENPSDLARLRDPLLALEHLNGIVVIDEIQRSPQLFPSLRVLADRKPVRARFLILGSASPMLLQQSAETLAGRIAFYEIGGFNLDEVGASSLNKAWLRGGFPRSYLARSERESFGWRESFVQTFLERDLPQLGVGIRAAALRRFWTMLAHYHGQVWNSSEFARSFGVADTTVRKYLDVLSEALVVRQLAPWFENISKRQVKAPKVYVRDSGLLHALLGIDSFSALNHHPKVGASWEGFLVEELIRRLRAERHEVFFWGTHAGAELDLLFVRGGVRLGFEIKRSSAPTFTPSMANAMKDLGLKKIFVIHAGKEAYPLHKQVFALPAAKLSSLHSMLR
jgi:hypothetical protein